jgi:hypothetical protein
MNKRAPIVSEFETLEQTAAYESSLARKVAASLADTRPPVSHDEAIARACASVRKQG